MARVVFFANIREEIECGQIDMKLAAPVNLSQLINLLVKEGGEHWLPALTAENVRVAVNQELIVGEVTVGDTDEIAFFPPVTGG